MLDNCLDDFRPLFLGGKHLPLKLLPIFSFKRCGVWHSVVPHFRLQPSANFQRYTICLHSIPSMKPWTCVFQMGCFFNGSFASERDQVVKSPEGFLGKAEVERSGILKQKHVTWLFPCQVFQCNCFFVKKLCF